MKKLLILLLHITISADASEPGGYLFLTFRGEGSPAGEQNYFMLSENARDWKALNKGKPILVSDVGEKGARDPFIFRSHDNSKFYLIATDTSIHRIKHDWKRASTASSKSILVWESPDLVNWSAPRLVRVSPDQAGCTWAPEAFYDEEKKAYLVFWSSRMADDGFKKHRMWGAYTKDFVSFDKPFVYIDSPKSIIDSTIVKENGVYYRFSKDEHKKSIFMEKSMHLTRGWNEVKSFSLSHLVGYEGPFCFQIEPAKVGAPAKWCLILDNYKGGKGYLPFETDNLASGNFVEVERMNFPFHVRHGSVLALTREEFERLKAADQNKETRM